MTIHPRTSSPFLIAPVACLLVGAALAEDAPWPQFRGPKGDGHAVSTGVPVQMSETQNVSWKVAIHGKGWSSPLVSGNRVWLTTATEDGKEFSVVGLDRATGKVVFDKVLFTFSTPEPLGNPLNRYASPTGLIDGERLYVHFGSYGTACLDAQTGDEKWKRTDLPCRHYRGPGSSLSQFKDTLILTMDGVDVQYLTALDKATGKTLWKTDRTTDFQDLMPDGKPKMEGDLRKAYTTPTFITWPSGKTHFISPGAKATFGYDAATGKELWTVTYDGFSNASMVLWDGKTAYLNTGHGKAQMWALPLTETDAGNLTEKVTWKVTKRIPNISTPVLISGHLYLVDEGGQCSCVDAATGDVKWSERLEGKYAASPLFDGTHLVFCSQMGHVTLVKPTPQSFQIAQVNQFPVGIMATPAIAGGELYLRTQEALYRIEKR